LRTLNKIIVIVIVSSTYFRITRHLCEYAGIVTVELGTPCRRKQHQWRQKIAEDNHVQDKRNNWPHQRKHHAADCPVSQHKLRHQQESRVIAKMTARCASYMRLSWVPRKFSGAPDYTHGYFYRIFNQSEEKPIKNSSLAAITAPKQKVKEKN